ncbi:MAG: cation transporter [Prevotella sp.]|nr:cation transporter [Prevotella sp.]
MAIVPADSLMLSIQAMHCGKCAHKVGNILRQEKGVEQFSIDLERRTASVTFNPSVTCKDTIMARLAATNRYIPAVYSRDEVMPRTIMQRIADMHCDRCGDRITSRLSGVSGIDSLAVDVNGHNVLIKYDANKIRKDNIRQTLVEMGFTPVDVILHHDEVVKGIAYAFLNIPGSAATDETVDAVMAIDGVADVCVNPDKQTMAVTYVEKDLTQVSLLSQLREAGISATLPAPHECKEDCKK